MDRKTIVDGLRAYLERQGYRGLQCVGVTPSPRDKLGYPPCGYGFDDGRGRRIYAWPTDDGGDHIEDSRRVGWPEAFEPRRSRQIPNDCAW
jgi:hypothetical protein